MSVPLDVHYVEGSRRVLELNAVARLELARRAGAIAALERVIEHQSDRVPNGAPTAEHRGSVVCEACASPAFI